MIHFYLSYLYDVMTCFIARAFFFSIILCLLTQEIPSCEYCQAKKDNLNKNATQSHPFYAVVPSHRSHVCWYDFGHWFTWALFGNDDDGIFGEQAYPAYRPQAKNDVKKAFSWWWRNPLHNFCYYVIGSAQFQNSELTLLKITEKELSGFTYSPEGKVVFAGENSSFFLGLHGWKPFISLRLVYFDRYKTECYLGWRCRGNFGIKCIPITKKINNQSQSTENTEKIRGN